MIIDAIWFALLDILESRDRWRTRLAARREAEAERARLIDEHRSRQIGLHEASTQYFWETKQERQRRRHDEARGEDESP